ncbi:sulfite oxidase isoform X2 [Colias croceus]|uniref:sulfite oxidase isoform X2 n=1 Tax=Colias crocea TaxID=72248 RepID=UPI001E27EF98|nr:sulfite oxidase isoform X2 [Colias croceus]
MSLKTLFLRTILRQNNLIKFAPILVRNQYYEEHRNYNRSRFGKATAIVFSSVLVGSAVKEKIEKKQKDSKEELIEIGVKRPDLPTYRAEEVSKHADRSNFWVTYKHGVYDVTEFLPSHPGGKQILNAGGYSIEPFWNVYGMHRTKQVYDLLESYRIGNLHDDDVVDHSDDELWAQEPHRDKRLVVKTAKPFNAEIPADEQVDNFDTPNDLFYVRQHMPVPPIDPSKHKLKIHIKGAKNKSYEFSLTQLEKKFKKVEVSAALMCAGNRRSEMNKVKPVKGLSWTVGAISNATWTGVYLRDVLLYCGVDPNDTEGKHVIAGADIDATGEQFSTSIPLHMALDPLADVLLATRMNGEPLPPDHGRPLRALVPGAPAVRSVKWLESITISTDESPSHWHQQDYRSFNASKTWETADFSTAPPVYSLPVTSAMCSPCDGDTVEVKDGHIELKGYAYSGGGAKILRVDISSDAGKNWIEAELRSHSAPHRRHYAWTLWSLQLPVDKNSKQLEIWVKATDSNFNTQPEKFDDIWNIRGILGNAYHRVKINLIHK